MVDIVVIGSASMDYSVTAPSLPKPGETVLGDRFFQVCGGKGANQAVGCARLGGRVALVARVGEDAAGQQIRQALAESGVLTDYVLADGTVASGSAHITVDAAGQNSIVVVPGANALLTPADICRARPAIATAKLVMLQLETPLETVQYAIEVAKAHGVPVMLDPAPAPDGPLPAEFYSLSSWITPNETEAGALVGFAIGGPAEAVKAARALRERGVAHPVVKLGAAGGVCLEGDQPVGVPAFRINAVDTTAAGDAFAAGLAVALVEGMSQADALRLGAAAGALTATRYGAQSALPTRAEVDELIAGGQVGEDPLV